MSRIDEALRRVAKSQAVPESQFAGDQVESRTSVVDTSILDRYAVEQPAGHHGRIHPDTAAPDPQLRSSANIRSLTIPAALQDKLVVGSGISPVIVEQYRRLAAALHDLQAEHGLKTLMISSALPQEGKTLTTANLALTLSESYHQRVLVIDADLRRPSLHSVFGIPNGPGLADVLNAGGQLPIIGLSRHLNIVTAGAPAKSPLAMLTSERTLAVLQEAATRFDWLLLDTPPVGFLPDGQLISRLCQGVLFVIGAGRTPYTLVQRAIAELGAEHIVGTVLNRVEERVLVGNESYGGYYETSAAPAGQR